jgi:hypothetical protein
MSDKLTKVAFGKILGEIYRLQRAQGVSLPVDQGRVYGLLNGIERAIDEELESVGFISNAQVTHAQTVLDVHFYDSAKLDAFEGFYDVEAELEAGGVSRDDAIPILRYFLASRRYVELIEKMDSKNSPIECKNFSLDEWSK